jgi:hypothetical protein
MVSIDAIVAIYEIYLNLVYFATSFYGSGLAKVRSIFEKTKFSGNFNKK